MVRSALLAAIVCGAEAALPCDPVHLPTRGPGPAGAVCRCNATYCDTIEPLGAVSGASAVFYQTSLGSDTDRLTRHETTFSPSAGSEWQRIEVNATQRYQSIIGFGGALTDAAALNYAALSPAVQKHVMDGYYSDSGLAYSVGRIPIASCDFSLGVYSYDDLTPAQGLEDLPLAHFSIAMDLPTKLPLIHDALAAAAARPAGNNAIKLFGSPWSPPTWMTTKNSSLNAKLRGVAGDKLHKSYAQYFCKFVAAYAAQGVDIWGVTVANEPAGNTGKWQDLKLSAEEERDFIKSDLGPALRVCAPGLKLIMLDDQRSHLEAWTDTVLGDPVAASFVDGIGVHWYAALEDKLDNFGKLAAAHAKFPAPFILGTEACEGFLPWSQGVYPGDWPRAETYAHDILGDLNHFAGGWTDWNILLDMKGGPNWAGNVVDAPMIADTESRNAVYRQPMYYYLGHITKFVVPGSVRIGFASTGVPVLSSPMECATFLTPDNKVVVVVLNRDISSHEFDIHFAGKGYINAKIPPRAMQTYIFDAAASDRP